MKKEIIDFFNQAFKSHLNILEYLSTISSEHKLQIYHLISEHPRKKVRFADDNSELVVPTIIDGYREYLLLLKDTLDLVMIDPHQIVKVNQELFNLSFITLKLPTIGQLTDLLLQDVNVRARIDQEGNTALHRVIDAIAEDKKNTHQNVKNSIDSIDRRIQELIEISKFYFNTIKLLKLYGADLTAINHEGLTAYHKCVALGGSFVDFANINLQPTELQSAQDSEQISNTGISADNSNESGHNHRTIDNEEDKKVSLNQNTRLYNNGDQAVDEQELIYDISMTNINNWLSIIPLWMQDIVKNSFLYQLLVDKMRVDLAFFQIANKIVETNISDESLSTENVILFRDLIDNFHEQLKKSNSTAVDIDLSLIYEDFPDQLKITQINGVFLENAKHEIYF